MTKTTYNIKNKKGELAGYGNFKTYEEAYAFITDKRRARFGYTIEVYTYTVYTAEELAERDPHTTWICTK